MTRTPKSPGEARGLRRAPRAPAARTARLAAERTRALTRE